MNGYFKLLKENKIIRTLSLVQLICYFGVWFSHTGIYTLLINLNAPTWAITAAAAFAFLPGVLLSPISGALVDRIQTRKIMLISIFLEAITAGMLVFIDSLSQIWFLLFLIFFRMSLGLLQFQAEMALLPKILSKENLKKANEINSIIWSSSYALGMALAGLYVHYFGVVSSFLFDMFLFFIAFFILKSIEFPQLLDTNLIKFKSMIKDGLRYILSHRKIIHLIFLHSIVGITSYDALVAFLAENKYKKILSVPLAIGFINATRAIALSISPLIIGNFTSKDTFFWMILFQGLGVILWGLLQFDFYLSLIGILATGFFTTIIWSYTFTILQEATDPKFYGRVLAYNDMVFLGIATLTSFLIGFLYHLDVSLQNITFLLGFFFVIASFYWLWIKKNFI